MHMLALKLGELQEGDKMSTRLDRESVQDMSRLAQPGHPGMAMMDFSDSYSIFDWGKMPDLLHRKGEALAILSADFFSKLEKPETWKEFSRSAEALSLRKSNRFGGLFNEIGEELQSIGLRTHLLGTSESISGRAEGALKKPDEMRAPFRSLAVIPVSAVKPRMTTVLGRTLPDYYPTRTSVLPRLIPFSIFFRFGCSEGSALTDRVAQDPDYLSSLGFGHLRAEIGQRWDFPLLELFTQLESSVRPVLFPEALALSGVSAGQLQDVLLKTAWISALLKYLCGKRGFELVEGKLEWALAENGHCFLTHALGPDELCIFKNGVQISTEFLKTYYKNTRWFQAVESAKAQAKAQGSAEWKKMVHEAPSSLPVQYRELAIQCYLSLTNELTGRQWFPDAWALEQVVSRIREFS